MAKGKSKDIGQVFTPKFLVERMLDWCGYEGDCIIGKHVIDNSCGDGAFLKAVAGRYIQASVGIGAGNDAVKTDLETYIHGIEIDGDAYNACIANLDKVAESFGITGVRWNILNCSALSVREFDGKMDYVVGNPPYVRVHNLEESYDDVKRFRFAGEGMTDLYLVFFELGFHMLNSTGTLCYITPSSWLSSMAAYTMRQYILRRQNMVSVVDLGHYQPFAGITSYTAVSQFTNRERHGSFACYSFDPDNLDREFIDNIPLSECNIGGCFCLSSRDNLSELREMESSSSVGYVSVKNGFATLADDVFIGDNVPDSPFTIQVLKASTGKWYKCLYPYDRNGKPLPKSTVFSYGNVADYFNSRKDDILKGKKEWANWHEFGRTQALKDTFRDKLAINCICRDRGDIRCEFVRGGSGVYSGYYIVTDYDIPFSDIEDMLLSRHFMDYIRLLRKYKSGGYYTFSTKDAERYINYWLTYRSGCKYNRKSDGQLNLF